MPHLVFKLVVFRRHVKRRIEALLKKPHIRTKRDALEALAGEIDCSVKTLQNWLAGRQNPFEHQRKPIANALGIKQPEILFETNPDNAQADNSVKLHRNRLPSRGQFSIRFLSLIATLKRAIKSKAGMDS